MGKALLHLLSNCSTSLNDITRCMVSQVHDITQVVLVNNYSMWSNTLLSLLFRFLCSSCNIRNFIVSLFIKKNNIVMSIMFWVYVAKYFCTTFRNILLTIRSLISLYLWVQRKNLSMSTLQFGVQNYKNFIGKLDYRINFIEKYNIQWSSYLNIVIESLSM